jgi:hypothetical protein
VRRQFIQLAAHNTRCQHTPIIARCPAQGIVGSDGIRRCMMRAAPPSRARTASVALTASVPAACQNDMLGERLRLNIEENFHDS